MTIPRKLLIQSGITVFAFILILSVLPTFSQDSQSRRSTEEWRVGLIGNLSRQYHFSQLPIVSGFPQCCNYEQGENWGWSGGVSLDYALLQSRLEFGTRISFAHRSLALTESYLEKFERFTGTGYEPFARRFEYSAPLDVVVADLGARWQLFQSFPLYLRLSADAAYSLFSASAPFEQETILNPGDRGFAGTGSAIRFNTREAAEFYRFQFGLSGALGAEFPIGERLLLGAEGSYRYGLTSIRRDIFWQMNALNAALTMRWRLFKEILPEDNKEENKIESDDREKPIATNSQTPLEISSFGGKPLEVQETIITQTFPLLPYIFFDSASTVVRNRYNPSIGAPSSFNENTLPKETMAIYYHILHIVGKRMRDKPASTLTITGTTDGKEWSNQDSRQLLALQRARMVASFLTGYWGIAASRIKLATRDTPKLASSDRYAEGNEENRRVELSSTDIDLLRPVVQYRFLEYTPLKSEHYLEVLLANPSEAASYKGSLEALGEIFAVTTGSNAPPERLPFALRRKFTSKLAQSLGSLDSARGFLEVLDKSGRHNAASARVPVKISKNQYEVSRLNLIVFDFDRDDMLEANRTMMQRFVNEAIKLRSEVSVLGSTDRLGEAKYNQDLSESRARGVQDFMRRLKPSTVFGEVRGTGASTLPFDNDLPEGRYYCRTVSITVQTPRE